MAAKLPKRTLTSEMRHILLTAARSHDWETLLTGMSEHRFAAADDIKARDFLLAYYADRALEAHHERWNKRIGGLLHALGIGEVSDQTAEEALAAWEYERTFRSVAHENAYENLRAAVHKGDGLRRVAWAAENVGIGWRETYLAALQAAAISDPDHFFARLVLAPHGSNDERARQRRITRIQELAADAGGLDGLAVALGKLGKSANGQKSTVVQRLWATYSALLPKRGDAHRVDAVTLLLGLLSELRGQSWLAAQVLARDGMGCARCGAVFSAANAPELSRLTSPRTRGGERASDYVLVCGGCTTDEPTRSPGAAAGINR